MYPKLRKPLLVVADNTRAAAMQMPAACQPGGVAAELRKLVMGQDEALEGILPYVDTYRAGLAPEGRPAGVFLLLGPTGTGKTKTVESLAQALHGDPKCLVKVNCGEFQMDHEVAKLIGAPPGYLGHRETQPMLTQSRLVSATSARSNLALVLFDEVEKAAPSLVRLLLGVLDKGVLRLGDGSSVNFERSLIFFTSNLGARNMQQLLRPRFTLVRQEASSAPSPAKLKDVAEQAARRHFSPEFMNRIDGVFTFQPLSRRTLAQILDNMIAEIQSLLDVRMPSRELRLDVRPSARRLLLEKGTSPEYGARELKRALFRLLLHPLAALLAHRTVEAGSAIIVQAARGGARLAFRLKPCRPAA